MEDLTKTQTILLTLLVSFVTSIATGIITVSLLAEAPPAITQTINRVVEKTVQQVVPTSPGDKVKEVTTVVVKEEDRIVDAITKNAKSVVRIYETATPGTPEIFFDLGLVVRDDGIIMTGNHAFVNTATYSAVFADGNELPLQIVPRENNQNLIFFLAKNDSHSSTVVKFTPISLSPNSAQLGQTVIVIGGERRNTTSVGRVSELVPKDGGVTASTTIVLIKTDALDKNPIVGSPLVNLSGEVLGVFVHDPDLVNPANDGFVPIELLKDIIIKVPKS